MTVDDATTAWGKAFEWACALDDGADMLSSADLAQVRRWTRKAIQWAMRGMWQ